MIHFHLDFNEMWSPRVLKERRLQEFARHLADGLPKGALPRYTRAPPNESYAHAATEFVAPDFLEYFADDPDAGKALDDAYENRDTIALSDAELLDLFRHGFRRSTNTPNVMSGWISGVIGWPRDPRLTEIQYQASDTRAPIDVRKAAIYYGFGLGQFKTKNILEAMYRVYTAEPFDRTTNGNMRSRILWCVRDNEDHKYYLATRFEHALRNHETLSDVALQQADLAYRQLTDLEAPNASEYEARGVYIGMFTDDTSTTIDESRETLTERFGNSSHLLGLETQEEPSGRDIIMAVVRGRAGLEWLRDNLEKQPKHTLWAGELLTEDLFRDGQADALRVLQKYLPPQTSQAPQR